MAQGSSASLEQRFIQHRDANTVPLIQGQCSFCSSGKGATRAHWPKRGAVASYPLCEVHTTDGKGDPDLFLIILFYSHVCSQGPFLNHYFVQPWAQHSNQFL